jgi:hypothetical protein
VFDLLYEFLLLVFYQTDDELGNITSTHTSSLLGDVLATESQICSI